MRTRRIGLLVLILIFTLLGCKLTEQTVMVVTATPEPATPTAEATATTPPTDTPAPTADLAATQAALAPTLPPTQAAQEPPTAEPTATSRPSQGNTAILERLSEDGAIGTTEGEYHNLGDFDQSIAKISYITWWKTNYQAENFVITANTAWKSASDKANWPEAGCGFVYSVADEDSYYLTYLALDGFVRVDQLANGQWKALAAKKYGKISIPDGDANLILAVYHKRINFYVNDQRVVSASGSSLTSGDVALTVLSGTNKDFGTRCQMSNIELWIFK